MSAVLKITPQKEIAFHGREFNQIQTEILNLQNVSDSNVAFKVKTTALKAYLVRPSSQVLAPGEKIDVQIMLQRLSEIPANFQHRFLVQALKTSESQIESKEAWTQMAKVNPLQEFRLSVVFPDVNGPSDASGGGRGPQSQYTSGSGADGGAQDRDLRSKYDELGRYTQKLQEQRAVVKQEIDKLQAQVSAGGSGKKKGYQLWHIIVAVMISLFLVKVAERVVLQQA